MLDSIIGSLFFEWVGAFTRWSILWVVNMVKGKKQLTFKEVWDGRKNSTQSETFMYGISNIMLGTVVVVAICTIIIWLGW